VNDVAVAGKVALEEAGQVLHRVLTFQGGPML
jgi:hypothetical protein